MCLKHNTCLTLTYVTKISQSKIETNKNDYPKKTICLSIVLGGDK